MQPSTTRLAIRLLPRPAAAPAPALLCRRAISTTASAPATVQPIYGTGPPPEPPVPSAEHPDSRITRRRKQAEMLRQAKELRASSGAGASGRKSVFRKRFWQEVHVHEVDGAYQVHLDARPLRHPTTKAIVRIPLTKPHLAHALALEWDLLVSVQQATKQHLVPLTSLVCRAIDIAEDDATHSASRPSSSSSSSSASKSQTQGPEDAFAQIRTSIAAMLLRYLDTDSLLCWAPPPRPEDIAPGEEVTLSLRGLQERTAGEIVGVLSREVWPGVEIEPVLDGESIFPRRQKAGVREIIQGWIMGLEPWDLAGLERAALASKSLLSAARLVFEWTEGSAGRASRGLAGAGAETAKLGVEDAARAASVEVDWQTGRWGEVEDTHDVEKEDLRRQLGSVVLLVSGEGTR